MRPHMLEVTHRNEGLFLIVTAALLLATLTSINGIFSDGIIATLLASFMISIGTMNVWARLLEGGLMLPLKEQYYAFAIGDGSCLPVIAVALSLMRHYQQGATLADNGWWKIAWMAIGVVSGLIWQLILEPNNKTPSGEYFYSDGQLHSPTHLWHSYYVIPVFIYLFGSQLPLLFTSTWGLRGLANSLLASIPVLMIVLAMIAFFFIVRYDGKHPKMNANVSIDWAHPFKKTRFVSRR